MAQAPANAPAPLLTIDDLAVSFDNGAGPRLQAVDGLRLTVHPKQTLAVVGESGCGKSVSALASMRLLPVPPARYDRGRILLRRKSGQTDDLLKLSEREMRKVRGGEIAMIFQEPMTSLNPVYTIGDQVIEAVLLHRDVSARAAHDIACAALKDVGITDPERRMRDYPHQFSGGMRQRVMIAMALACEPSLLLADEPTTALDVTIQAQVLGLLRSIQASRSMGIMLITHALGVVAEAADTVCVMYAGRIVEYARVGELFRAPLHPYTRGLMQCIPSLTARLARLATIKELMDDPGQFERLEGTLGKGARPWWPWHQAPKLTGAGAADPTSLVEIEPEHWVRLWRTDAVAGRTDRPPDLSPPALSAPVRAASA